MQVTSVRLPAETWHQIEWLKIWMREQTPIKFTTTDIIKIAIDRIFKAEFEEYEKKDTS